MVFNIEEYCECIVSDYLDRMSDLREKNVSMDDIIRISLSYNLLILKIIYLNLDYARMYPTLKNELELNCKQIAMQIDKFENYLKSIQTENNQIIQV